jgi:hypothetical protein
LNLDLLISDGADRCSIMLHGTVRWTWREEVHGATQGVTEVGNRVAISL